MKKQDIKNIINEVDDYETVEQDGFIIGDRLANHWLELIKPDAPSRFSTIILPFYSMKKLQQSSLIEKFIE